MKYFVRFIMAFLGTAMVYYLIITYINYGFLGFSVVRLLGMGLSVLIFFLAIRHTPWIIRLSNKMRMNRIERHGVVAMAIALSIAQFVLAEEGTSMYHRTLLNKSGKLIEAIVVDCEDGYCDCEYVVEDRVFQQKFRDQDEQYQVDDTVQLHYLKDNPNVYRIAEMPRNS